VLTADNDGDTAANIVNDASNEPASNVEVAEWPYTLQNSSASEAGFAQVAERDANTKVATPSS